MSPVPAIGPALHATHGGIWIDHGDGRGGRIGLSARRARQPVERAGESFGTAGGGRQPFLQFGAIDLQIGEQRISQAPPHRRRSPARRIAGQGARVEVERLDQPHQQRGRDGPLIALDQVQIAGRDVQHVRHRGL